jgi:phage FluMu protein Com
MSITFKCEHCGKKIEAPDAAGGKWGKCPGCKNKVYVPSKEAEAEGELRLAPIDTEEEKKRKQMLIEEARLRQEIMSETDVPEEGKQAKREQNETKAGALSDAELELGVIAYLRQMADGDLEAAERTAKSLVPAGKRTIKILERIALSEIPEPEIADIPRNVLAGLIKGLREKFK